MSWQEPSTTDKLYRRWQGQRIATLEPHYSKHVFAMTVEGLHGKGEIAAELAWRDALLQKYRTASSSYTGETFEEVRARIDPEWKS